MKKIYKAKSGINGYGIFAGEDIKKGEFVFYMKGKRIHHHCDFYDRVDRERCANWVGLSKDHWIIPEFPISFMNHSCEPNLGTIGSVTFKALRNIKRGEELTFDYSISDPDVKWYIECTCGSKYCRKTIRSIQFLPRTIFKKYLPYIPKYFQRVYLSANGNR